MYTYTYSFIFFSIAIKLNFISFIAVLVALREEGALCSPGGKILKIKEIKIKNSRKN